MAGKKKVIMYCPKWYPSIGGMETNIRNQIFNSDNFNYTILTNGFGKYPANERLCQNASVIRIPPNETDYSITKNRNHKIAFPLRLAHDLIRIKNVNKLLEKESCDILHVHYPYIPHTIFKSSQLMKKAIFKKSMAIKNNSAQILTLHGLLSSTSKSKLVREYEMAVLERYDTIICVDKNLKEFVLSNFPSKNIHYIPNSIDTSMFCYKTMEQGQKLRVGFIGRLESSRGIELLTALAGNLPEYVDLSIIGSGSKIMLKKFKEKEKTSRYKFFTNIPNDRIPAYLHNIDILFNPVVPDGISRITMEAMACGRPVIMLEAPNRGPVISGKTGFLVKPNIESILATLNSIYADRAILDEYSRNCRNEIEANYSNEVIIPQIETLYNSTIAI